MRIGQLKGVEIWPPSKGNGLLYDGFLDGLHSVYHHNQTIPELKTENVAILLCYIGEVKMRILANAKASTCLKTRVRLFAEQRQIL